MSHILHRHRPSPIFILGISQRSGTNFLFDLLCLHPDCGAPSIKWEDFLVDKSDLLVRYVSSVYSWLAPSGNRSRSRGFTLRASWKRIDFGFDFTDQGKTSSHENARAFAI